MVEKSEKYLIKAYLNKKGINVQQFDQQFVGNISLKI